MTLEVRPSNAAAVTLYKKLGFEILGTRKNYYTNPNEDAYLMGLVLDQ
jgi:ribosomal-protein-alanine N-acetyltransferase